MEFDYIQERKIQLFRFHYLRYEIFIKSKMIVLDIARQDLFGGEDQITSSLLYDLRNSKYTEDKSNIIILIELLYIKFKEKYYNNLKIN